MSKHERWGVAAAIAVLMVASPALAANVTVGRFYTEIAQVKQLSPADATAAEASLRGAGYNLPKLELGKSLTEGDMISISHAMGLSVTTQRPAELVSEAQLNTFMSSFRGQLSASTAKSTAPYQTYSQGSDPGNSGNGKGKKKGHNKSGAEPE